MKLAEKFTSFCEVRRAVELESHKSTIKGSIASKEAPSQVKIPLKGDSTDSGRLGV